MDATILETIYATLVQAHVKKKITVFENILIDELMLCVGLPFMHLNPSGCGSSAAAAHAPWAPQCVCCTHQ